MSKPIIDKGEISIDFPEKYYYGTFSRDSSYDVTSDAAGLHIFFDRRGDDPRHVGFHMHWYLLAGILDSAAEAMKTGEPPTNTERANAGASPCMHNWRIYRYSVAKSTRRSFRVAYFRYLRCRRNRYYRRALLGVWKLSSSRPAFAF